MKTNGWEDIQYDWEEVQEFTEKAREFEEQGEVAGKRTDADVLRDMMAERLKGEGNLQSSALLDIDDDDPWSDWADQLKQMRAVGRSKESALSYSLI